MPLRFVITCFLQKLEPLKIRYHGVFGPAMPYDERYTPYIKQAGLLPWIQLVSRSTPNLNAPLVSALLIGGGRRRIVSIFGLGR